MSPNYPSKKREQREQRNKVQDLFDIRSSCKPILTRKYLKAPKVCWWVHIALTSAGYERLLHHQRNHRAKYISRVDVRHRDRNGETGDRSCLSGDLKRKPRGKSGVALAHIRVLGIHHLG